MNQAVKPGTVLDMRQAGEVAKKSARTMGRYAKFEQPRLPLPTHKTYNGFAFQHQIMQAYLLAWLEMTSHHVNDVEMLTTQQVADELKVSTRTVINYLNHPKASGYLPGIQWSAWGGHWKIPRPYLDAFNLIFHHPENDE